MKSKMYSQFAEQYDRAVQSNIYNAYLERPSLQALIGDISGLDVLDLGCGSGVYAEFLLAQGATKITCIDLSEQMIELVRSKLGDRVLAYSQDLSLGLPEEANSSADLIICPLVIHYLEDLCAFFKEVHRVLKTGGYIVFSTHHPFVDFQLSGSEHYFARERVDDVWDTIGQPVEVSFYRRSLSEMTAAITDNGLVISALTEGQVAAEAKAISPETYERLSNHPNFIFMRCEKR